MTPRVKICGITTLDALAAAIEGGASYIGLVFFSKSPRHVELAPAAKLANAARGKTKIVALTVNADDAALESIVSAVKPDFLQLHGDETPHRVADIKQRFGVAIIKAIPVASGADANTAFEYSDVADLILFDAKAPNGSKLPGGNGVAFDWSALDDVRGRLDYMLSGGLNPDNVATAIADTGAAAVDVSSGVEIAPGQKDVALIRRFLHAVNTAKQAS